MTQGIEQSRVADRVWPPPRRLDVRPGELRVTGSLEEVPRAETNASLPPEGYRLTVDASGVTLESATEAGEFYGRQTLRQLAEARAGASFLPFVRIEDEPLFGVRGVMLDVSRDKVPTMETLRDLLRRFAHWKLNHVELYVEHTFAYPGHEAVWEGTSPLTPGEIRELDELARALHIDLVPNQQSFGHLHHWLVHERYRGLAEVPEGVRHPFALEPEPFSLCPTDPRSLEFLAGLYDSLLPHFSSRHFNVGLDETFDLGQGRSRAACEERGTEAVYVEFLAAVQRLVAERGRRMLFWADVVLEHPESLEHLPADCVPILWGYDAGHPFEEQTRALAASGLEYWVCPGTSSWQSFAGRTPNARANLERAAHWGARHGARGYLVADWGDRGHHQPQFASELGWLVGAGCAWAGASAAGTSVRDHERRLSRLAFDDPSGTLGSVAVGLGEVAELCGAGSTNGSPLFFLLSFAHEEFPHERFPTLSRAGLAQARARLDELERELDRAPADHPTARECRWALGMLRFSTAFGRARLDDPGAEVAALSRDVRARLAADLEPLVEEHRRVWMLRNRPGGLERSCGWLERVLGALR